MPEQDAEVQKALENFDKELDAFISVKEKIERNFRTSKETDKHEERAFQLQMFELQRGYDTTNTILTATIAVGFSFLIAIATVLLTVPSLPPVAVKYLSNLGYAGALIVAFTLVYIVFYHKWSFPNKLAVVRRQYIDNNNRKEKDKS